MDLLEEVNYTLETWWWNTDVESSEKREACGKHGKGQRVKLRRNTVLLSLGPSQLSTG